MEDDLIQKEICNQVALGQWELAKSLILTYWNNAIDQNSAREWVSALLVNICAHPETSVGSLSIPSNCHLSWLAIELIEELNIHKPDISYLQKVSEFKLYIYKASEICKNIPYDDLTSIFESQNFIGSSEDKFEFSDDVVNFVYDLKTKNPLLASHMLKFITQNDLYTKDLSFDWLRKKCEEIKTSFSQFGIGEYTEKLCKQLLAEVGTYVFTSELPSCLPQDIVSELTTFCSNNILERKDVYQVLIGNSDVADHFCKVEDHLLDRYGGQEVERAEKLLKTILLPDGSVNTKELCLRSMRQKEHFLEIILNSLLILVIEKKYKDVDMILTHSLVSCVRPLLVLLSWEQIENKEEAVNCVECLWPDSLDKKNFEPVYIKACDKLVRNIEFAQWCLEQRANNPNVATTTESDFSILCSNLKNHSVLYVLKHHLQLSKLNLNTVEDILQRFMTPKEKITTKEKIVRFASDLLLDDKVHRSDDCKILQSYCIMSAALEAVQFSAEFDKWCRKNRIRKGRLSESVTTEFEKRTLMYRDKVINNLEEIKQLLPTLYPLINRLEILENLFTLIFTTHNALKNDSSTDSCQSSDYEDDTKIEKREGSGSERKSPKILRSLSDSLSALSNCSGSSACSSQRFICDDTIVQCFLTSIKDNLLDISMKLDKRYEVSNLVFWKDEEVNNESLRKLQERHGILKKYVSEAIWRFEIVTASKSEECGSFHLSPCPVYLNIEKDKMNEKAENGKSKGSGMKSAESLPSSNATSTTKSRKRPRQSVNSTVFEGCSNTKCSHETVNKMLASKESLLNMCLQQMNSVKAQQVVKVFGMEKTNAANENTFSHKYIDLAKQFQVSKITPAPLLPALNIKSSTISQSLSFITSAAAAGVCAAVDVTTVDDFLSRCVMPNIPLMEEYIKNPSNPFTQELTECQDLKALVLCDLAFTSCHNFDSCKSLLHAALQRMSSVSNAHNSGVMRLSMFANRMLGLINEVSSKQNGQLPVFVNAGLPKQESLCNVLLHGSIPLEMEAYSRIVNNWNTLFEDLANFYAIKKKCNGDRASDNQLETELQSAFIKLVRNETTQLKQKLLLTETDCQYPNYLKTMSLYMRQLAALKAHQNPELKDPCRSCNFLKIIDQGLTGTLIEMIREKDVMVEWVEKFAIRVGLDFNHIITQASVGIISANAYQPIEYGKIKPNKYGQYTMNQSQDYVLKTKNPKILVEELWGNILQFLEDKCDVTTGVITYDHLQPHFSAIIKLLESTKDLASVDLKELETTSECYAFLINVINLLNFHTLILRIQKNEITQFGKSRLLNEACQATYKIGQFGVISLFELRCLVNDYQGGLSLPQKILEVRKDVMSKHLHDQNPKIIFLLTQFFLTSPKLTLTTAETLEKDAHEAMTEYLNAHISINTSEKEIHVPEIIITYYQNADSNFQDIQSFLKAYCKLDGIQEVTSKYQISTQTANYFPAVVFSYPKKGFESFPFVKPEERITLNVTQIPKHVREYLKEKCWLVDCLINVLDGQIIDDKRISILNNLLNEFSGFSAAEILVPAVHEINFWIDLEDRLNNQDVWDSVFEYLEISSSIRVEMKSFITPLRDIILCHLHEKNSDEFSLEKIKNVNLQSYCVLALYRSWNYKKCMDHLLILAADRDLSRELHHRVVDLCERVEIYGKIAEVSSTCDDWQSVEEKSVNSPEEILHDMNSQKNYSLALNWAKLHPLSEEHDKLVRLINLMFHLDKEEPDTIQATIILEKIADRKVAIDVCEDALSSLDNLASQVFNIEYLLNDLDEYLTETRKQELHLTHMGIKIMSCLNQADLKYFNPILSSPALVLEQLIMNTKIELFSKALKIITPDMMAIMPQLPTSAQSIKSLIKKYAKNSLEVKIIQAKLSPSTTLENVTSQRRPSESFCIPLNPPKKEDWVADELVVCCMVCQKEQFNMFNRRHHCRRCGRVICANCSQHKSLVYGYGDVKVRVCDDCKELDTPASNSYTGTSFFGTSGEKRNRQSLNAIGRSPSTSSIGSLQTPYSKLIDEPYQWQLSLNEEHNKTVREEFYFEQTPNVTLCISLLDCFLTMEESAYYVLELCETLFTVLQPLKHTGMPNPEVNHNVIINVIETLIMSAKVKFANLSNHTGMGKCDQCLNNLNLMKLLITSNCYHLMPSHGISSHEDIRRLRDQLVAEERWNLALEVTSKNRLEANGVWGNWGLALLKTCQFAAAREKFGHCLEKNAEKIHFSSSSDLMTEIIKHLEINLYKPDEKIFSVANRLASLKQIRKGGGKEFLTPKRNGTINTSVFNECVFYLRTYGSASTFVSFLVKHRKLDTALQFIQEKKCDSEVFTNALFLPCLRAQAMAQLEKELLKNDPSLRCWQRYLLDVCSYLERSKFYNSLYKLQKFCKDHVRAALTCIKLFYDNAKDYNILYDKVSLLNTAGEHLLTAIRENQYKMEPLQKPPLWKVSHSSTKSNWRHEFTAEEIHKRSTTLEMQIEVTNYFKQNDVDVPTLFAEMINNPPEKLKTNLMPTFFGNVTTRTELCALVILGNKHIETGFEIATKYIEQFQLDRLRVFSLTGRTLVKRRQIEETCQLIGLIIEENKLNTENIDELIGAYILSLVETKPFDTVQAETLIKLMSSYEHKVNAYILCDLLKKAFQEATNKNNPGIIREIAKAAERTKRVPVINMCTRWFDQKEKEMEKQKEKEKKRSNI